jgi:hypothetical protein
MSKPPRHLPPPTKFGGVRPGLQAKSAVPSSAIQRIHAPPSPLPPLPILTATSVPSKDQEGMCGYFVRVRNWHVANPVQGFIVQEVRRTFNVRNAPGRMGRVLSAAEIDRLGTARSAAYATETHYWELWTVDALGNISDGGDDTFSLCALTMGRKQVNTTVGTFVMTGTARFYSSTGGVPTVFRCDAVNAAGGLHSSLSTPSSSLPAAVGATVTYTVNVAWNSFASTPNGRYSVVT